VFTQFDYITNNFRGLTTLLVTIWILGFGQSSRPAPHL